MEIGKEFAMHYIRNSEALYSCVNSIRTIGVRSSNTDNNACRSRAYFSLHRESSVHLGTRRRVENIRAYSMFKLDNRTADSHRLIIVEYDDG